MKHNIATFISILGFLLSSCAEEGAFSSGELNKVEFSASEITATTALVTVTFPQSGGNLTKPEWSSALLLSTEPFNQHTNLNQANLISYDCRNEEEYFFTNLKPDTRYYVMTRAGVNLNNRNGDQEYETYNYSSNYSFTTAKEGDYSAAIKPVFTTEFVGEDFTLVKLSFNSGWKLKSNPYIRWSTTNDFSDANECAIVNTRSDNYIILKFPQTFNNGEKIYLKISGEFEIPYILDFYNRPSSRKISDMITEFVFT